MPRAHLLTGIAPFARDTLALGPPVDRHRPVGAILPYILALPIARPDIVQTPFLTRCILVGVLIGKQPPPTGQQRRRGCISKQPSATSRIFTPILHPSVYQQLCSEVVVERSMN